jgi:tetrathionate reductase subunit B
MVTDIDKCMACEACTAACNAEWDVPAGHARTRIRATPLVGAFPALASAVQAAQCNQCDRPPCVDACPSGASAQHPSGVVTIDRDVCIGCGFCLDACPYDARYIDPATRRADKCDFCLPRIQRGEAPACVSTCPADAKTFGDLEDRSSDVFAMVYGRDARRLETRATAVGPNVYYVGSAPRLDQVASAFAPREPRVPAAADARRDVLKPLVLAAVGAAFAGQAVAFFNQLRQGESEVDE